MTHSNVQPDQMIACFGPFRLTPRERLIHSGQEKLVIGSRALDILIALVERQGEVLSRQELMDRAWPDLVVEEANLRVHIARLRKCLGDGEDGARYIANVPGRGYCFVAPVKFVEPENSLQEQTPNSKEQEFSVGSKFASKSTLPTQLKQMVGREATIKRLSGQLLSDRFVSIVGTGGLGKTTVAVSVAHFLQKAFDDSVVFVDLAALSDGGLLHSTVASILGYLPLSAEILPGLAAYLHDRRMLLVLDNCEHVIAEVTALCECLFSMTNHVHLLTTSREPLRAEGEQVHLLGPLRNANFPPTAAQALTFPAVQLFMQRAIAGGYENELNDADAAIVTNMCRRLDGIPLAIELVAGRVGAYGIQGTAELLDQRFRLLWQGRRSALPRQQTLYGMMDWSHNLLCERDRRVLRRLSVVAGAFTLGIAQDIADEADTKPLDVAAAVESLLERSLVLAVEINGSSCYRLLDTTRAYAQIKLEDAQETDAVERRHAVAICEGLRREGVDALNFIHRDLSAYAPFMGDVRSAHKWAFSNRGDRTIATELASLSAPYFLGFLLLDECRNWCERALAELDASDRGTMKELALQHMLAITWLLVRGNGNEVRIAIERGLVLADTLGRHDHVLHLLAGLNLYLLRIGEFEEALSIGERAKLIAVRYQHNSAMIVADWLIGVSHHLIGDQIKAQQYFEAGFHVANAFHSADFDFFGHPQRVRASTVLARTLWLRGFPDRAIRIARQSIDEAGKRGHAAQLCMTLAFTARIFLWRGDLDDAIVWVKQADALAAKHSMGVYRAHCDALFGEIAIGRGDLSAGTALLREALARLNKERHNTMVIEYSAALADGLARSGCVCEAGTMLDDLLEDAQKGDRYDVADLLRRQAELCLQLDTPNEIEAERMLLRSLDVAKVQGALSWELRSAILLARIWFSSSRSTEARGLLADIYARFTEGLATSDLKLAKQMIG